MAYNRLLNFKRICKFCKSNRTASAKKTDGVRRPNWYIDYTTCEGGWVCSNCYYCLKEGIEVKVIEEFEICSASTTR